MKGFKMKSKKIFALALVTSYIAALSGCNTTSENNSQYANTAETSHTNSQSNSAHSNVTNPQSLDIKGSITGYDTKEYIFHAQANQVLRVVRQNTSDDVVLKLLYLGNNNKTSELSGDFQVLPYTGDYKLIVSQTRNDARKHPNTAINFNLKAFITDQQQPSNQQNYVVNYECDGNKNLSVTYHFNNQKTSATVTYGGISQQLNFDTQYSKKNNPVFSNNNYSLSVGTINDGVFGDSTVYSLVDLKKSKDGYLLLQNCQKI